MASNSNTHTKDMHAEATQTVVPFKYGRKMNELPSAELVRKMFDYDPDTGLFTWKKYPYVSHTNAGKIVGNKTQHGYRRVGISGRYYFSHRLIWVHHHGSDPNGIIDHINGDRSDNRISNLRAVDYTLNSINQKMQSNNKSGFKNVHLEHGKWTARIKFKGVIHSLGYFQSAAEAWEVARAKRLEFGYPVEFRPKDIISV